MLRIRAGLDASFWKRAIIFMLVISSLDVGIHGQDCNTLLPSQYIYETSAVHNADQETAECNTQTITGKQYTFCNHPVRLTDSNPGPSVFNSTDTSSYYRWNTGGGRMMFVLPVATLLSSLQIFYYVDSSNEIGRPKIRILLVDETFKINDTISFDHPDQILDIVFAEVADGLKNQSLWFEQSNSNHVTTKVVLEVQENKRISLALSEITFCTAEPVTGLPEDLRTSTMSPESSPTSTDANSSPTIAIAISNTTSTYSTTVTLEGPNSGQRQNNLSFFTPAMTLILLVLLLR